MPTTKFKDIAAPTGPGRARARAELDEQLARYAGGLADLRHRIGLTQTDVAAELELSQAQVSRLEKGTDALVSSIARYIDALGGELKLIARIDGAELVFDLGAPSGSAAHGTPIAPAEDVDLVITTKRGAVKAAVHKRSGKRAAKAAAKKRAAKARPKFKDAERFA